MLRSMQPKGEHSNISEIHHLSVCHYNSFREYNLLIVPSPDVSGDEYDDLEYNELIADLMLP